MKIVLSHHYIEEYYIIDILNISISKIIRTLAKFQLMINNMSNYSNSTVIFDISISQMADLLVDNFELEQKQNYIELEEKIYKIDFSKEIEKYKEIYEIDLFQLWEGYTSKNSLELKKELEKHKETRALYKKLYELVIEEHKEANYKDMPYSRQNEEFEKFLKCKESSKLKKWFQKEIGENKNEKTI